MRNRFLTITAALLLATAASATAQESAKASQQAPPAQQPTAPGEESIPWGTIDFGYRGTSSTGDDARYDRYTDLRDGAATRILLNRVTDQFRFEANAYAIGYRDQEYNAHYTNGKATLFGNFNSIPLNYLNVATSPWSQTTQNVFTLDAATRLAIQNKQTGVVGVPQNAAQLATASAYRNLAQRIDLSALRQAFNAGFNYDVSKNTAFNLAVTSTTRTGSQPWGASFAFNNANELPMALDNRTNDINAGLEFSRPQGMLRVGYNASFFNNHIKELVWDNPIRATDTTPYDPSGYSNGNGPAQGRMAMAPSNSMNGVTATGLYKLPAHSNINGSLTYAQMNQNEGLIPWTINPVIANPTVYQSFPGLAHLPRSTAEAKINAINGLLNFTSRPNRYVGLQARYRFNDRTNKTPMFDAIEYVRFDAVPEETGGETEAYSQKQNTFDLSATFNVVKYTSLKLGYTHDGYERWNEWAREEGVDVRSAFDAFGKMADNTFRATIDTVGNQYVMLRGMYEHTKRTGSDFSQEAIIDSGSQPGVRFFDFANRDRDKGTLLVTVTPVEVFDVTFSMSAGKDDYASRGAEFGLLDTDNHGYNVGVTAHPFGEVAFGASFGRDHYISNQASRNANPPPDAQFTDATRNWTLKNDEMVDNVNVFVDVPKIARNVNVRVNYDFSNSDNGFIFGGPRIAGLAAIGQFIPLPNVTNSWHRVTGDVQYFFTKKVGVGVGYWYEKFDVNDFATIDSNGPASIKGATGTARIDYLGEISTGYGNRPYKGSTGFVRLLYNF